MLLTGLAGFSWLEVEGTTLTSVEVDVDTATASSMILMGFMCGKKDSLTGGKLVDRRFHFPSVCTSRGSLELVVVDSVVKVVVLLVVVEEGVVMTGK